MSSALNSAPRVVADNRRSITAPVIAALLCLAATLPDAAWGQNPGRRGAGSIGAPEPPRPRVSVPYDGALAAYRAGRIDEALQLSDKALEADARNPELRFLRGVILTEQQRTDDALAVFAAMIKEFPELPEPYNNVAVIYAGRGDWDNARLALEQSTAAVPSYALAHENLGDIHLQLAARAYAQAAKLEPRNDSAKSKLTLARELINRAQALPAPKPAPSNARTDPSLNPRLDAPIQDPKR